MKKIISGDWGRRVWGLVILTGHLAFGSAGFSLPKGYSVVPGPQKKLQPLLINGRTADVGEFPEVVMLLIGNSLCTGTVVGPRALLTAAHCLDSGVRTARFVHGNERYTAELTPSPLFVNQDHDITVGLIDREIRGKLATVTGSAAVGEYVTLTGYGCTSSERRETDGVLRVGDSSIIGFSGYDAIARREDGSALCFGDSGGPAFVYMADNFRENHRVLAVNSKGNIQDTSLLTRTDARDSQDFLRQWTEVNRAEICGINKDCWFGPPSGPDCRVYRLTAPVAKSLEEEAGCTRLNRLPIRD